MTIICPKCELQLRPVKTGQPVELMSINGPYQFFMGDTYGCPGCGLQVISGVGAPITEHFRPEYAVMKESFEATDGKAVQYWSNSQEKQRYRDGVAS